jgi:hypothetical protein
MGSRAPSEGRGIERGASKGIAKQRKTEVSFKVAVSSYTYRYRSLSLRRTNSSFVVRT